MSSKLILPKGIYHDRMISAKGQIIDFGWHSNIIVDRCRYLLAAFMKDDPSNGIQVLKIGRGQGSWDDEAPDPSVKTIENLTDSSPIDIPISADKIEYLDSAGDPTTGPTNRLKITITLNPGTPPIEGGETTYPLREFGLFGQFSSQEYMVDYVRHPVIHKQADDTLERTIRLIF